MQEYVINTLLDPSKRVRVTGERVFFFQVTKVIYIPQCPTVTLEERSKRRNFGRITPNFGLFQWIRRHFWCFD